MTVFVLPCGISILENMKRGKEPWKDCSSGAAKAAVDMVSWAQNVWDGTGVAIAQCWRAEADHRGFFQPSLDMLGRPRDKLSAELASLVASGENLPRYAHGDSVVLLASDTPDGVLAAHLNATCIAAQILYCSEPPPKPKKGDLSFVESPGAASNGAAYVVRIPGLVPTHTDRMRDAAGGLGRTLVWVYRKFVSKHDRLIIHVAGGYKATIPILVGIAEHLPPSEVVREVWCKHEDSTQAIRLPVRRLGMPQVLRSSLTIVKEKKASAARDDPWIDYAYYQRPSGQWELTGLGNALLPLCDYLPPLAS